MLDEFTTTEPAAAAAPKKKHHVRRIILSVVSVVLLLTVGTGAAYVAFLNHTATTTVKTDDPLPTPSADDPPHHKDPHAQDSQTLKETGS